MENNESHKLLQQLHDEINHIQTVDEKGRELLRDIDGDIRTLLEPSKELPMLVHPSIVQRLESGLSYFEVTHPKLTSLISKVLASLSNAGV